MPVYNVVCVPSAAAQASEPPCVAVEGVNHVVELRPADGAALDVDQSAQLFSYSFSAIVALFLVGLAVGSILRLIKSM